MKIETKIGLLFTAMGIIANRVEALPDFAAGFLTGLLFTLAIVLYVISLLPEGVYNRLPYRKRLAGKKDRE